MQNFSEQRFPTDISYGIRGGPKFTTEVITASAGHEYRNINGISACNKYNLASGIRNKEQLDQLLVFFRAMHGRAIGFRFKDWIDYAVQNQYIATADGQMQEFQLVKTYQVGSCFEQRLINKPVENTAKIYFDNILVQAGIVNPVNGVLSFRYPPKVGTVISVDFEFDVPVRFDTDHICTSIENYGVYTILDLPLIEVKV